MRAFKALVAMSFLPICSVSTEPMTMLHSDELRQEIFGIHLFGHEMRSGMLFDECIEPSGETVYRTRQDETAQPYSEPGQLEITELAQACFSYPPKGDPGPACFRVFRYGDGFLFESIGSIDRFVASSVLRGIERFPEPGAFLS